MLALTLAQVQAPPADTVPDDIVVIGERLKRWTGKVTTTIGVTSCRTTVSTGDREIDAVGCAALKECWSEHRPAYAAALKAKDRPAALRTEAMLGQCLKSRRDTLVAALAERRAAARSRS